jgi:hypothetical protein
MVKKNKKLEVPSQKVQQLADRLSKEWSALYGELFVSAGFGFHAGFNGEPHDFLYVFTDDKTIKDKLPTEVDGFPVKICGIPVPL